MNTFLWILLALILVASLSLGGLLLWHGLRRGDGVDRHYPDIQG